MMRYPLSVEQRSMLFYDRLLGLGVADNNVIVHPLPDGVSEERLRAVAETVTGRHAALRSGLTSPSGTDLVVVSSVAATVAGARGDRGWAVRRPGELSELHMDRTVLGLSRWEVGEDPEGRPLLLIAIDHLVSDAHSCHVIRAELDRLLAGEEVPAPVSDLSYDALCRRQATSRAVARRRAEEIEEWSHLMAMVRPLTGLTELDEEGWAGPSQRTVHDLIAHDGGLHGLIRGLSQRFQVTPFVVAAAVCAAATWWRTGVQDFVIFTPVSTRRNETTFQMVGNFVVDRPVVCRVRPELSFRQLLSHVAQSCQDALQYLENPVPELVELGAGSGAGAGSGLLGPGTNYLQLHVTFDSTETTDTWPDETGGEWRRTVLGPYTPGLAVDCTTVRFTVDPRRSWVKVFYGGPSGADGQAVDFAEGLLQLLHAVPDGIDEKLGELMAGTYQQEAK